MRREDIVEGLRRRGYQAEKYENMKNGVLYKGILFRCENGISPVIYTDDIIREEEQENRSVEHAVNLITEIFEANKELDIDKKLLLSRDFILSNIRVGLQKKSAQHLEKGICRFEEMETYLYFAWDAAGRCSAKLTPEYLERAEIALDEAWETAYKNTFAETTIKSMASFIENIFSPCPMYIITNKMGDFGASAILDDMALKKLDEQIGNRTHKFFVLPSSVHEMILIPYDETVDINELSEMVKKVNRTEVRPEEQLSDRAYVIKIS